VPESRTRFVAHAESVFKLPAPHLFTGGGAAVGAAVPLGTGNVRPITLHHERKRFPRLSDPMVMDGVDTFESKACDLSGFSAVNNNSNFAFRIVTEFESTAI
jgi:hypothetical protein